MPMRRPYGDVLGDDAVVDKQVPQMPTSKTVPAPIQIDRWFRNGLHPDANAINMLGEHANAATLFRSKQVFSAVAPFDESLVSKSSSADRTRWRCAFHTSPYHSSLLVIAAMLPGTQNSLFATETTSSRLDIYSNPTETTLAGTLDVVYGVHPRQCDGTPNKFSDLRIAMNYIEGLNVDSDYFLKVTDVNYGRIQSICIIELNSLTDNNGGYPSQNNSAFSTVTAANRENIATIARNMWRRGCWPILNWTNDDPTGSVLGPPAAPATATNLIDNSSTTISASTPGFVIDMTNKDRLSQSSGVPCIMWVCAFNSSPGPPATGDVYLKSAAGSTIASVSGGWTGTPKWQWTTFNMPAIADKYDLQFADSNTGLKVVAVSIYQYES